MDWNRGYIVDSGYVYEYFNETNPAIFQFLAKLKNHSLPEDNFRYLELGCGQGFNLICIAALNPNSEFVGVDFYPEHIAHARGLAHKANIHNVSFYEADFVELAEKPESLGSFHVVAAHGITTWVSGNTREKVFEISSKVLEPGGVMYNSYNTLPGWLPTTPFQHLVIEYQRFNNGIDSQRKAMEFFGEMRKEESMLFKALPGLGPRLDGLKSKSMDYLLQEYNHPVWQPMYSSQMLRIASNHKLNFLASAKIPLAFSDNYTDHQNKIFNSHDDIILRECVKDIYCNIAFRQDIYAKGANPLWVNEAVESIKDQFVISTLADIFDAPGLEGNHYVFNLTSGNTTRVIKEDVQSILSKCQAGKIQIRDIVNQSKINFEKVVFIISLLLDNDSLALVKAHVNHESCIALNKVILNSASNGAPYRYLVSPNFCRADRLRLMELIITDAYTQEADGSKLHKSVRSKCESLPLTTPEGEKLTGKSLQNFVDKSISDFKNERLPLLARSGAIEV